MKARSAVAVVLIVIAALSTDTTPAQSGSAGKVTGANRLFTRFVEDAAIVPSYWLEGQAFYQSNTAAFDIDGMGASESSLLGVGPVFALNVAEDFEFGVRGALVRRDPDNGGSDTGLTDFDLWGKVAIVTDPVKIALGILVTAPTGSEDKFLGSGEVNVEFFGGVRKDFSRVTLAGNAGWRVNQDPDFPDIELEGKSSLLVGGAALIAAGERVVLTAEYSLETERYEGLKNDSRLLGGFEFRQTESLTYRGAAGGGLSDGAPDFLATGSVVWTF